MKLKHLFLLAAIILSACGPSQSDMQTQIAQSIYATQTAVATSTYTPTATDTFTPTPTFTLTPSLTPTDTATPTTPPETLTAIAVETQSAQATLAILASQTAIAQQATATREQYIANITSTANAIALTRTEQATIKTATAASASATRAYFDQFAKIDYRELVSYADNHTGEMVQVRIRVFNVIDNRTLQGYFAGTYEAVYIESKAPFSGVYENASFVVYGQVKGYKSFQNAFGADISQPFLGDAFLDVPPAPPPPPTPTPLPGGAVLVACNPSGGYANVDNVQSFFIESHSGSLEPGNGVTGQYMSSFERAIYYAKDGSGPYVFCTGKNW